MRTFLAQSTQAPTALSSTPMRRRSRQLEASAVAAIGPVIVIAPFCLLALLLIWLAVRLVWDVSYWWFVLGYVVGQPCCCSSGRSRPSC